MLICEYCGKAIDKNDWFIHEIEREGDWIIHEGYLHQECYVNSFIKDIEKLGFEVIRPRSEINEKEKPSFDLSPDLIKTGLSALQGLLPQEKKNYDQKKEEALEKIKRDGEGKKTEKKSGKKK